MPNANYEKGRRKEYKIVKELKSAGCTIAQRTAGSHSPIDVFGINKRKRHIIFIQSKPDNYTPSQIAKIMKQFEGMTGKWWVSFKVM